jgi:putative Holliday junction resolvase
VSEFSFQDFALERWISLPGCQQKGACIGLDWGKKRLGLAVSDDEKKIALPLKVLEKKSDRWVFEQVQAVYQDYKCVGIVVGWPLLLDSTEGKNCQKVQQFVLRMAAFSPWPLALWDERLSSGAVQALRGGQKDDQIDHHAAAVILQGALDRWHGLMSAAYGASEEEV